MSQTSCRLSHVAEAYEASFQEILGTMIRDMTDAPLSDSISHNFIVQMIPHHRAAIEMSQNILQYTTFLPVQDIAEQIVTEQTQSIADMERILDACGQQKNSACELESCQTRYETIFQNMFSNMKAACVTNHLNRTFMRQMIPHHRGAVEMSELTLTYPICPELVPVLTTIISSQKRGIQRMQQFLQCMAC